MSFKKQITQPGGGSNNLNPKAKRYAAGAAAIAALPLAARGDDCLITYDELSPLGIIYSRVHLRRLEKEKKFPSRVRLSERRIAWRAGDIRNFLKNLSGGAGNG